MSRQYTNKLIELCDEGKFSKECLFDSLLKHFSEDQIKDFCLTGEANTLCNDFLVIESINFNKDGEHFDYDPDLNGQLWEFLEEKEITHDADDLDICDAIESSIEEVGSYNAVLPWGEHGSLYIDVNMKSFNE